MELSPVPRWPIVPHPATERVFSPSPLLLAPLPLSFVSHGPGFDAPSRFKLSGLISSFVAVTHDMQVLWGVFALSRTFFRAFSSLAWVFICCTSMESTFLLRMNRSWLPMHSCRIWRQKIFIHRNVTQLSFGRPLSRWTNQLIHTQLRRVELENILLLIEGFDCELQRTER